MWSISRHAAERILDMAIDPDEVWNCINNPSGKQSSRTVKGAELWHHNRITLVVNPATKEMITALWGRKDDNETQWDRSNDLVKATTTGPPLRVFYGKRRR